MKKVLDINVKKYDDESIALHVFIEDSEYPNGKKYGVRLSKSTQNLYWYCNMFRALARQMERINGSPIDEPETGVVELGRMNFNGLVI